MKNIKVLLGLALAGALVFSGCSKDDEEAVAPLLEVSVASTTVESLAPFYFAINARQGDANLSTLAVKEGTGFLVDADNKTWDGSDAGKDIPSPYIDTIYVDGLVAGTYVFDFTVTDKDDLKTAKSITITVADPVSIVEKSITLGAQASSTGSFYGSSTGVVYSGSDSATFRNICDITVGYDDKTAMSSILASLPERRNIEIYQADGTTPTKLGSILNGKATYYKIVTNDFATLAAADFDAITDAAVGTSQSVSIAAGNVIMFKSAVGTKGYIKVVSIASSRTGNVSLTVKTF